MLFNCLCDIFLPHAPTGIVAVLLLACGIALGRSRAREASPSALGNPAIQQPTWQLVELILLLGSLVLAFSLFHFSITKQPLPMTHNEGVLALSAQALYETGEWTTLRGSWQGFVAPAALLPFVAALGGFTSDWRLFAPFLLFSVILGSWFSHEPKVSPGRGLIFFLLLVGAFPLVASTLTLNMAIASGVAWFLWWMLTKEYRRNPGGWLLLSIGICGLACVDASKTPQISAMTMLLATVALTLGHGRRGPWALFIGGYAVSLFLLSSPMILVQDFWWVDGWRVFSTWKSNLARDFEQLHFAKVFSLPGLSIVEYLLPVGLGMVAIDRRRRIPVVVGLVSALVVGSSSPSPLSLNIAVFLLASLLALDVFSFFETSREHLHFASLNIPSRYVILGVLMLVMVFTWGRVLSADTKPLHGEYAPQHLAMMKQYLGETLANSKVAVSPSRTDDPYLAAVLYEDLPELDFSTFSEKSATFFPRFEPLISLYYWPSPPQPKTFLLTAGDFGHHLVQETLTTYFPKIKPRQFGDLTAITLPGLPPPWGQGVFGSYFKGGSTEPVLERLDPVILLDAHADDAMKEPMRIVWEGTLFVPSSEEIPFRLSFSGGIRWEMAGAIQLETHAEEGLVYEIPLTLDAGFYPVVIEVSASHGWPEIAWEWAPTWIGEFTPVSKAFLIPGPDPRSRFTKQPRAPQ
jgi:hypothetical protein